MARKKRKKKEPFEFKAPEFDEVAFMRREVEGAKAAMITLVYAFAVAVASWALTLAGVASLGGLLGLAAVYGLRYLFPLAGIDLSRFDWKVWAGNGAIHLFAWFAFWILLLNPPFIDVAPPVIHNLAVPGGMPENLFADDFGRLSVANVTSFQVLANVTDNQQLVNVQMVIVFNGTEQPGGPMRATGNGAEWAFTVDPAARGTYTFTVEAVDRVGHRSTSDFNLVTS